MKVTVIDEVPVIEVTVIKPTAGSHGTMDATTGKTTHATPHATHVATAHAAHTAAADETTPAASTDRQYSADMSGTHNLLEVRRASYRLS